MTQSESGTYYAPHELPERAERAYFVLAEMRVAVGGEPPKHGLYVPGRVVNHNFVPSGDVAGQGEVGQVSGQRGWLELARGEFQSMSTSRPPFKPYLEGTMTSDRGFVPSTRVVQR